MKDTLFTSIAIVTLILFLFSCSRTSEPIDVVLGEDTVETGRNLLARTGLNPEQVGYIVYDADTGEVVQSHNRNRTFIPASVTKILTILAAFDILGPNFRFDTFLYNTGEIRNNSLEGDIYLRGTGDPLLTVADLLLMVLRLREMGIREVTGNFYYDESELQSSTMIDKSMDIDASYNPGISSLSLEYNTIYAQWTPEKNKEEMKIFLIPELPINNAGVSNDSPGEDIKFSFRNRKNKETWLLSPEVDRRGRERLPVRNPGLYTAHMFKKIAGIYGIKIKNPQPGKTPPSHSLLYRHKGRPIKSIADVTLTYSNNLMAELLCLGAARKLTGKSLNMKDSGSVLMDYFTTHIRKVNWEGFRLVNGSGLTSQNRISPEQMLGILLLADRQEFEGRPFISYLPASGWEWSMMTRLNNPQTAFYVWAKTGTINYAIALSGYIFTRSNRRLMFAFFINDIPRRRAFERNPDRRSKDVVRQAYRWINANKSAMDTMLEFWIQNF